MESISRLELATLPTRHPKIGLTFLTLCGAAAVLRLSIDPLHMPAGTMAREITINRVPRKRPNERIEEVREIGWDNIEGVSEEDCIRLQRTFNAERITEDAAIAIMALLIHELEEVTVAEVLPIGSGTDYLVTLKGEGSQLSVEVSGIRVDATGSEASSRLQKKYGQLLAKQAAGFVSVTTFQRLKAGILHSYLHYVAKSSAGTKSGRRGQGKGRKRS